MIYFYYDSYPIIPEPCFYWSPDRRRGQRRANEKTHRFWARNPQLSCTRRGSIGSSRAGSQRPTLSRMRCIGELKEDIL